MIVTKCNQPHPNVVSRQQEGTHSMKTLRLRGLLVIAAHSLVAIWHLLLTTRVLPAMSLAQAWLAIGIFAAVHLVVAVVWWLLPSRPGGIFLFLLFAVALAFGTYEHFLSASPNNILRMSPGEGVTAFRISSILLFLLEAAACWFGFQTARIPPNPSGRIHREAHT